MCKGVLCNRAVEDIPKREVYQSAEDAANGYTTFDERYPSPTDEREPTPEVNSPAGEREPTPEVNSPEDSDISDDLLVGTESPDGATDHGF